jgi:thiamine-monophosphate kinase
VSAGLLGDLRHVLRASAVGATLDISIAINLIAVCARPDWARGIIDAEKQLDYVLAGGDDYELAFTAPASKREAVQAAARQADPPVTRIGQIDAEAGPRLLDGAGRLVERGFSSFDHFA